MSNSNAQAQVVTVMRKAYESARAEQYGAHGFQWSVCRRDDVVRCVSVDFVKQNGSTGNDSRLSLSEESATLDLAYLARVALYRKAEVANGASWGDLPCADVRRYAALDMAALAAELCRSTDGKNDTIQ